MANEHSGMNCWGLIGDIAGQVGAGSNTAPPFWFQPGPQGMASAASAGAADSPEESEKKRDAMIALLNKWLQQPTTLSAPFIPDDEKGDGGLNKDLLKIAGWDTQKGIAAKAANPPYTSCGDVLTALLKMWHSNILGAFNIRDETLIPTESGEYKLGPGAAQLGLYIKANGSNKPLRGDIVVLKYPPDHKWAGYTAHVAIFIKEIEGGYDDLYWQMASGGGGKLPEQSASISDSEILGYINNIPKMKSPTDDQPKVVDGWVSLEKLKQTGNWTY